MLRVSLPFLARKNFDCAPGTSFGLGKIHNNSELHDSKNVRSPLPTQ